LRLDFVRPGKLFGPVLRAALARLAAICFSVAMTPSSNRTPAEQITATAIDRNPGVLPQRLVRTKPIFRAKLAELLLKKSKNLARKGLASRLEWSGTESAGRKSVRILDPQGCALGRGCGSAADGVALTPRRDFGDQ
jgi:hypothetical protein